MSEIKSSQNILTDQNEFRVDRLKVNNLVALLKCKFNCRSLLMDSKFIKINRNVFKPYQKIDAIKQKPYQTIEFFSSSKHLHNFKNSC